ncbi:MAG: ferrochelatase [Acidobacteriota bacterium]|nr:ferrochelatase [Acidobacteriota bacterium]
MKYDALLVVSFGGPEKNEDVIPFLENVLRGRTVPRERMLGVAAHYYRFNGRSPINDQNRELIRALDAELAENGPALRIYWGNRNWRPLLADALRTMKNDGVRRALAFVTSAFSSYSSCRQYRENIEQARLDAGESAPVVDKLRVFYNHPRFIYAWIERVREALGEFPPGRLDTVELVFTAHSIPQAMAAQCAYVRQLEEACGLISAGLGGRAWKLVYQSRSGPPAQPWLEPSIHDYLKEIARRGSRKDILIVPVGFVSDHMEVVYDLDVEIHGLCRELGLNYVRPRTPGAHPEFVRMIRELIMERMELDAPRRALGSMGPNHDICPADCCLPPARPQREGNQS